MEVRPKLQSPKLLSDSEKELARTIAQSILSLKESEAWGHFVKAAEALIQANTPQVYNFTQDQAVQIASKNVFCSGVQACLNLVNQQEKILESLK
jgi:hypothetical protein